ncbi:MAG: type II toxin-antitoxin system VapC family toxin [Pseudonocardia sp.]
MNSFESAVLDSSAVLAWLRGEPGADLVHPLLPTAIVSAANWSEIWQKLDQHGVDADRATHRLRALGVAVEPLTVADAVVAAKLWAPGAGLSLGDRCCLALAGRLGLAAVTADRAWSELDIEVPVRVVR